MSVRLAMVLCTGHSARSQMAEGLINSKLMGRWHAACGMWHAALAGTQLANEVHPLAVRAMAEIGIDISRQVPRHLSTLAAEPFDTVITVCDNARTTRSPFRHRANR